MAYELPPLPYPFDALEPHIDAKTMQFHHDNHHATYVTNVNKALEGSPLANEPIEKVLAKIESAPENIRAVVRNHGGGHANHSLFWTIMGPKKGGEPVGKLADAIKAELGGFEPLKTQLSAAAMGRFGSGWGWLVVDKQGRLVIESSPNQDSPLMNGSTPILGLDVWEHAYYLKYQYKRADYVGAFFNVIDWDAVNRRFEAAKK